MFPLLLLVIITTTFHVSCENGTASHQTQNTSLPSSINAENGQLLEESVGWTPSELDKIVEYTNLARGKECQYDIESSIRNNTHGEDLSINKHKILSLFEKNNASGSGKSEGVLCDSSKLLECTEKGVCECIENTEPRKAIIDKQEYQSDYCYSTEESCHDDPSERMRLTEPEKAKFWNHYGNPSTGSLCYSGNYCLFLKTDIEQCTKVDTGKTGLDLFPDEIVPTASPGNVATLEKPGRVAGREWSTAGVSCTCSTILIILLSPLISITIAQITNLIY